MSTLLISPTHTSHTAPSQSADKENANPNLKVVQEIALKTMSDELALKAVSTTLKLNPNAKTFTVPHFARVSDEVLHTPTNLPESFRAVGPSSDFRAGDHVSVLF